MLKYRIKRKNKLKDQSGKKLKKEEEILCGSKIFSITWHGETLMSIFFFLILILMLPFKQLAGPC